jgi:Protein of unknown function (DUF4238)
LADLTTNNHYVPQWYQRRFLPAGQTAFVYLDLQPEEIVTPTGKRVRLREKRNRGPGKCFEEKDLYTTRFFGEPNDAIERFLFGAIDTHGSRAIEALASNDMDGLSRYFGAALEYMDAQILRTPRGLSWLKRRLRSRSQDAVLLAMRDVRRMHCTMWGEGVMEVVFADDSDVPFLLTDNPVTVYNKACFPASPQCRFPNFPSTKLIGSQTIFPLDLRRCLIITNLEYARRPNRRASLLHDRTNARYFPEQVSMVRFDSVIRKRKLKTEEVAQINYILKVRATRFIAAAQEELLFPERHLRSRHWSKLGDVLLPGQSDIIMHGGEMFAMGKDWFHYQDEFGRVSMNREEHEARKREAMRMQTQIEEIIAKEREAAKAKK